MNATMTPTAAVTRTFERFQFVSLSVLLRVMGAVVLLFFGGAPTECRADGTAATGGPIFLLSFDDDSPASQQLDVAKSQEVPGIRGMARRIEKGLRTIAASLKKPVPGSGSKEASPDARRTGERKCGGSCL